MSVMLSKKHALSISDGNWAVEAKAKWYTYAKAKLNSGKKRLDVNLRPLTNIAVLPVAPHGASRTDVRRSRVVQQRVASAATE